MKKHREFVIIGMVMVLVGMFAINVYQGYRYERSHFVARMNENEQEKWFEKNKEMLSVLSVMNQNVSSAASEMGLSGTRPGQTILIETGSREESNGEWKE